MLAWKNCNVCESTFTIYLQNIYLQRQGATVPQHYCMECESFFHVSDYKECDGQHQGDAAWLSQHPGVDHANLAKEIVQGFGARTTFEAGCGTGDLLLALEAQGAAAAGVDPNRYAVAHAIRKGARASVGYFQKLDEPVEAIFAVDVMEHLTNPRDFFTQLRDSVVEGGLIVVRVPELTRDLWHFLRDAAEERERAHPDPFTDNSVHITHFSTVGIQRMGESLSTTYIRRISGNFHVFRREGAPRFAPVPAFHAPMPQPRQRLNGVGQWLKMLPGKYFRPSQSHSLRT